MAILIAGCTSLWQAYSGGERRGVSSSLVEYLYPDGEEPPPYSEAVPQLNIPLRVGLAFVPATRSTEYPLLSEATKTELLGRVRQQFLDREYISEIEVIPDAYMRTGRGFSTLDQIARMHSLDVMALLSYDQVAALDDTTASFLYWTIIGAYVVEGSRNDVQTFVDTAVFDIPTRKLMLRAPGTNKTTSKSTLIDVDEELRKSRTASFTKAIDDMTQNLTAELDRFEVRLKEDPTVAHVTPRSGGGSVSSAFLFLLLAILYIQKSSRKRGGY
jgi:rhombotail lipoprotein